MSKTVAYAQWSLEPYCIGLKLRALRNQKRLTLAQLAAETGLSTALLSKLETDRMIPTLPTLATIGRVYGVGMSHFFAESGRHTLSITRKAHLQGTERGLERIKFIPLHAPSERSRLRAQVVEFPAGAGSTTTDSQLTASRLIYVLEGKLELESGGIHEVLDTGDCVYIESEMSLAWKAAGKQRCRILTVSPGDRRVEG